MKLRRYKPEDCAETARLFYETVHRVNARDYTPEQQNAWAPEPAATEAWNDSLMQHDSWVATENGRIIGFADMDPTGYLDRLYVRHDFQRQGVAKALCDLLEDRFQGSRISTHASITAKGFFEHRGYRVIREQFVGRAGVQMKNFIMVKDREDPQDPQKGAKNKVLV